VLRNPNLWEKVYSSRARAQELCVEAQQVRWRAAHIRNTARLTRLARHMPGANSLTLALTTLLLRQRSLLTEASPDKAAARSARLPDGTSAPLGIRRTRRSSADLPAQGAQPFTSARFIDGGLRRRLARPSPAVPRRHQESLAAYKAASGGFKPGLA
jgi:hypothetical protein